MSIQITINKVTIIYLLVLIIYLLLHELIHAVLIPNIIHSNKTFWGMNGFFGFVYTEEIVTKSRFLIISIMPLFVLSYLVPVIVSLMGMMNGFVLFLCLLNAGGACVDLLNIILVTVQVPRRGLIINNGLRTFYKAAI